MRCHHGRARRGRLAAACAEIREAGGQASHAALDVADIAALRDLVKRKGPFDILVNCAGLARHGPALASEADFDAVAAINVKAAYFAAQAVAQGLVEAGRPGSIIQMSSQMGHVGGVDRAVYCATKHAVEGMTKAMAIEWGAHGIRVNTAQPHLHRTPLTQSTFDRPERREWIEARSSSVASAGRGHHGRGALPRLGRLGAGHGHDRQGRRWVDSRMSRNARITSTDVARWPG
jgi:NAD(P)-dependent dehydrogenase (short-subunit alcohol dehydrogenase family)